jgi:hypothetical protein
LARFFVCTLLDKIFSLDTLSNLADHIDIDILRIFVNLKEEVKEAGFFLGQISFKER